jgi:hypothetical protein
MEEEVMASPREIGTDRLSPHGEAQDLPKGLAGEQLSQDAKAAGIEPARHEPAPEPVRNDSAAATFTQRLNKIWEATHGSYPTASPVGTTPWTIVRDALLQNQSVELIGEAIVESRPYASRVGARALEGDAATVQLLVSAAVERATPEELTEFIGSTLPATVERLEAEGRATRESIADIVLAALFRLDGVAAIADVLSALFGYLAAEEHRPGVGQLVTAGQVGRLLSDLRPPESHFQSAYIYHFVLRGVWREAGRNGQAQELVSKAAGNLGIIMWRLLRLNRRLPGSGPDPGIWVADARGTAVLRALRGIGAVCSREPAIERPLAEEVLVGLGLEHPAPAAALAVVEGLGALANPWSGDPVDVARLEASSAVVAAGAGERRTVAPRLYNAAVTLRLSEGAASVPFIGARLALNALGLRWALRLAGDDDLLAAMAGLEGLDCATSLLGDSLTYQDVSPRDEPLWSALTALAQQIGGLPRELAGVPSLLVPLARIDQTIRRLAVPAITGVTPRALAGAADQLINVLQPGQSSPAGHGVGNQLVESAWTIRELFEQTLGHRDWGLRAPIAELVERRQDPLADFRLRYEPYAGPIGDRFGAGTLVPGGLLDSDQWRSVGESLHRDPGSIAPHLVDLAARLPSPATSARWVDGPGVGPAAHGAPATG